jgi:rubrerythrin
MDDLQRLVAYFQRKATQEYVMADHLLQKRLGKVSSHLEDAKNMVLRAQHMKRLKQMRQYAKKRRSATKPDSIPASESTKEIALKKKPAKKRARNTEEDSSSTSSTDVDEVQVQDESVPASTASSVGESSEGVYVATRVGRIH